MAEVLPLGTNFDLGFQSDTSRDELNPRAAFRMYDYLPQMEAPLRGRGGWRFGSPDLSSLGPCSSVASLGWLPFQADGQLVAVGDTGTVFQLKRFDGSGGTRVIDSGDGTIVPTQPVFWHRNVTPGDMGVILGGLTQPGKAPKKYYDTGSLAYTAAPLGGTPPLARMGFSWGDYLVLGNFYDPSDGGKLKNNRWAFSDVGLPETWLLTGANQSVMDFPEEIVCGLPLQNTILAFGYQDVHSVTGRTPPPGGDLDRRTLFAGTGTFDGRSVVGWRSYAIWANNSGVWMSDGATLSDLTAAGGISVYYRQLVTGLSFVTGASAVAGIYRDHYVLTLHNQAGVLLGTLVCDIQRKVWTMWTNVGAACYAHRAAAPGTATSMSDEELYFGSAVLPRVCRVSSLWTPSAAYAYDGDGAPVQPVLETPYYRVGGLSKKRLRFVYTGYDLRAVGGATTLDYSFALSPEPGAPYVTGYRLPATSRFVRKRMRVARGDLGVGFRFAQNGASASTRMYSIETEAHPWEVTR